MCTHISAVRHSPSGFPLDAYDFLLHPLYLSFLPSWVFPFYHLGFASLPLLDLSSPSYFQLSWVQMSRVKKMLGKTLMMWTLFPAWTSLFTLCHFIFLPSVEPNQEKLIMCTLKFHSFLCIFSTSCCTLLCTRTVTKSSIYCNDKSIIHFYVFLVYINTFGFMRISCLRVSKILCHIMPFIVRNIRSRNSIKFLRRLFGPNYISSCLYWILTHALWLIWELS